MDAVSDLGRALDQIAHMGAVIEAQADLIVRLGVKVAALEAAVPAVGQAVGDATRG